MDSGEGLKIYDRAQAGRLLSRKLLDYKNTDAVVLGIPRGGVTVAAAIAAALNLSLEVIPCRKIRHPSDRSKSIGSASCDEVVLHDCCHDIPQDYLFHQVAMLQSALKAEKRRYDADNNPWSLLHKTVIVADDFLQTGDTMLACLKSVRKQMPSKIIVAVPFVSAEALSAVRQVANEVVFDRMEQEIRSADEYYDFFPKVYEADVKAMLHKTGKESELHRMTE